MNSSDSSLPAPAPQPEKPVKRVYAGPALQAPQESDGWKTGADQSTVVTPSSSPVAPKKTP